MLRTSRVWWIFLAAALLNSCSSDKQLPPSGSLYEDTIGFEFAAYYLTRPTVAPEEMLRSCIDSDTSRLYRYYQDPDSARLPSVMVCRVNSIQRNYPPPDTAELKHFGFGMSAAQIVALQQAQDVLIMDFTTDRKRLWDAYRTALAYLYAITCSQDAIIYDQQARVCYTPQAWKAQRMQTWQAPVPDLRDHIAIRKYRDGESCRAMTLGMGKFGLPDLVLQGVVCQDDPPTGNLMHLICQTVAEKGRLQAGGSIALDIDSLGCETLAQTLSAALGSGAGRKASVPLVMVKPGKGMPVRRLMGLRYAGRPQVYQQALIDSIFGTR